MAVEANVRYALSDWALLAVAGAARIVHWVVLSIIAILLAALLFENSALARQVLSPFDFFRPTGPCARHDHRR